MPVYIAMLRGINVGGNKRVTMDLLRSSFEGLGLQQVKTYIQSGNVVFSGAKSSPAALSKKIEKKIISEFGFSVAVICRTAEEILGTIEGNPFLNDPEVDPEKLHVAFLAEPAEPAALKKLADLTIAPDRSRGAGREVYFYFPNGVSQSSLWKHPLDRVLGVVTTMRNWRTVNTLHQMCMDCR
jgi:uncharacterized protein (DUF1697 family)